MTLFATDPALFVPVKRTTTARRLIKVDSNFTCEYDAEGYFPGNSTIQDFEMILKICFDLDPKYCHIYHFCAIGAHQVLECYNNLWYSTETHGCEWPDKSDCTIHQMLRMRTIETVHLTCFN